MPIDILWDFYYWSSCYINVFDNTRLFILRGNFAPLSVFLFPIIFFVTKLDLFQLQLLPRFFFPFLVLLIVSSKMCMCVFVCVWLAGQPAGSCWCKEGFGGLRCDRWETCILTDWNTQKCSDRWAEPFSSCLLKLLFEICLKATIKTLDELTLWAYSKYKSHLINYHVYPWDKIEVDILFSGSAVWLIIECFLKYKYIFKWFYHFYFVYCYQIDIIYK